MNDMIDEADDDLYEPPPGPSPNKLRKQAAERGDVDFFLDIFRTKSWALFSVAEMLRYLMRAAEVRARTDPEGFAGDLFGRMVGFNAFLLLRSQLFIADRVVGRGPKPATPAIADLSLDVVERLLPRLAEIQRSTAELLVAQAQATRLWGLSRAKQAQAERAAPVDRPKAKPDSSGAKTKRPKSAAATGEIEGGHGGVIPIPTWGRRRC